MQFNFHGNYSPKNKQLFINAQETDLKKICNYLKTDILLVQRICFEIFDTKEGKQNADPNHSISRASARFKEMTIYRFWLPEENPHFPHETTHLVAHTWASPYILETELDTWDNKKIKKKIEMVSMSFMQEGLAIAVDDIVFKKKLLEEGKSNYIDDWCRKQIDKMPQNLTSVINLHGFGSLPNKVVVPFTASFSKFLLQSFRIPKYRDMYIQIKETKTAKENVTILEKIYGKTENELLSRWRSSI